MADGVGIITKNKVKKMGLQLAEQDACNIEHIMLLQLEILHR